MSSLVESLAKELGSSMDAVRDAALQRVSSVLSNSTEWDEVEFLKLWKGLFYALWNLDGENEQVWPFLSPRIAKTLLLALASGIHCRSLSE